MVNQLKYYFNAKFVFMQHTYTSQLFFFLLYIFGNKDCFVVAYQYLCLLVLQKSGIYHLFLHNYGMQV